MYKCAIVFLIVLLKYWLLQRCKCVNFWRAASGGKGICVADVFVALRAAMLSG